MKNLVISVLMFCTLPLVAQNRIDDAKKVLRYVIEQKGDSVWNWGNDVLQEQITPKAIGEIIGQLSATVGKLDSIGTWNQDYANNNMIYYTDLKFEKTKLRFLTGFDKDGKINNLLFMAVPNKIAEKPIAYDSLRISEKPVVVNSGNVKLNATYTVPVGRAKFPIVVFIHGSGPNDRDETIGSNKMFRDIALGLAENGIASLRYDKRTFAYAGNIEVLRNIKTPEEEVIADALAAVQLASSLKGVCNDSIYLLGHSLGGYLLPQIASRCSNLHGIIICSGNTRPIEVLLKEQINYIYSLNGKVDESKVNEDVKKLMGAMPQSYIDYLKQYEPVITASKLNIPILILQGERDYQVTMADFGFWKLGLWNKSNVTAKSYPKLNHIYTEGEGPSTPFEYNRTGRVPLYVIKDIVNWIR